MTIMERKLFFAPLEQSPRRVLDLGTGTGIWAIDFGKHSFNTIYIYFRLETDELRFSR